MTSTAPHYSAPQLGASMAATTTTLDDEWPSTGFVDARAEAEPAGQPEVKRHRTAPTPEGVGDYDANTVSTETSAQAQVALGEAYFTSTASTSIATPDRDRKRRRDRKLRLYLGASLADAVSGKARYAYAVVYIDQPLAVAGAEDVKHHSQTSAVTEEGAPAPAPAPTGMYVHKSANVPARGALLGRTERARLQRSLAFKYCTVPFYKGARSVDFAKQLLVPYVASTRCTVHVDVYAGAEEGEGVLLGSASVDVGALHGARGYVQTSVLASPQIDAKRPPGHLRAAVEDVSGGVATYHLDLMCACVRRARPWGASLVRRTFYTVHTIATSDARCVDWVLLYRSAAVETVRKKGKGGSMEYNYFSSRPLLATPGLVVVADDTASDTASNGSGLRALLRRHDDASFFSMPSGSFATPTSTRRLKLSVWEDSDQPELVACSEFTMEQLRSMGLGARLDMQLQSNVVGHATLKFVEKSDMPQYFCLNIQLPDLLL